MKFTSTTLSGCNSVSLFNSSRPGLCGSFHSIKGSVNQTGALLMLFLSIFLLISFAAAAQEFEPPTKLPKSKKEFAKSEQQFIAVAKWLESTPIDTTMTNRMITNAWTLAWITNCPTVTVEVRESVLKLFNSNSHLMLVWMAGYTRYCLENNYSSDKLKANTAGIRSAISCYNLGGHVRKQELLSNVIEKDKEGTLEEWVKDALESK